MYTCMYHTDGCIALINPRHACMRGYSSLSVFLELMSLTSSSCFLCCSQEEEEDEEDEMQEMEEVVDEGGLVTPAEG